MTDDGVAVPLPEDFTPPAGVADRPLTLGVRPEHLTPDPGSPLRAPVQVIEPLGNETLLYLKVGDAPVTVRVNGHPDAAVDRPLGLRLQAGRIHCFDAESGRALTA